MYHDILKLGAELNDPIALTFGSHFNRTVKFRSDQTTLNTIERGVKILQNLLPRRPTSNLIIDVCQRIFTINSHCHASVPRVASCHTGDGWVTLCRQCIHQFQLSGRPHSLHSGSRASSDCWRYDETELPCVMYTEQYIHILNFNATLWSMDLCSQNNDKRCKVISFGHRGLSQNNLIALIYGW